MYDWHWHVWLTDQSNIYDWLIDIDCMIAMYWLYDQYVNHTCQCQSVNWLTDTDLDIDWDVGEGGWVGGGGLRGGHFSCHFGFFGFFGIVMGFWPFSFGIFGFFGKHGLFGHFCQKYAKNHGFSKNLAKNFGKHMVFGHFSKIHKKKHGFSKILARNFGIHRVFGHFCQNTRKTMGFPKNPNLARDKGDEGGGGWGVGGLGGGISLATLVFFVFFGIVMGFWPFSFGIFGFFGKHGLFDHFWQKHAKTNGFSTILAKMLGIPRVFGHFSKMHKNPWVFQNSGQKLGNSQGFWAFVATYAKATWTKSNTGKH